MDVALIGAGSVGSRLGSALTRRDHRVRLGVREPSSYERLGEQLGSGADVVTVERAAGWGDLTVLAVPWDAVDDVMDEVGDRLDAEVVVDVTNPLEWDDGPVLALAGTSNAERIRERLPGARVVKAFNTIGAEHLPDPRVAGREASMPVAADDEQARQLVLDLAADLGFDPVDAGPLRNARLLEAMAALWIHLSGPGGLGRGIGFRLLRPGEAPVDGERLAGLLAKAETAHRSYEETRGEEDPNWPTWYAEFVLERLREG